MAASFFYSIFCCCAPVNDEEHRIRDEREDETSRLIPDSLGPTMEINPAMVKYQRLQHRLGTIVRDKERKMVNVGSRIPFNLHNQVLPPEANYTVSHSASGTLQYYDGNDDYGGIYQPQLYTPAPYPRFTTSPTDPYDSDTYYSRSGFDEPDVTPKSILNVRLVGYVSRRGRTPRRQRPGSDEDIAAGTTPTVSSVQEGIDGTECLSAIALSDKAKLEQCGALSMSWGD